MNHQDLFSDALLKRIPMASITMALSLSMEHVPDHYVAGHLAFKQLHKWVYTGSGKDKLLTLHLTLIDEVERSRKKYVEWEEARAKKPVPVNLLDDRKKRGKKAPKKTLEEGGMQPMYGYRTLRALLCAVNVALGAGAPELVDLLECLDEIPSISGAEPGDVESITSVLQSLDSVFDSSHWKDIVNAA